MLFLKLPYSPASFRHGLPESRSQGRHDGQSGFPKAKYQQFLGVVFNQTASQIILMFRRIQLLT
jgi:hypothetical protein